MLHLDLWGFFLIGLVFLFLQNASIYTKEESRAFTKLTFAGYAAQRVKFFNKLSANYKPQANSITVMRKSLGVLVHCAKKLKQLGL
jgi:hypothetical protein